MIDRKGQAIRAHDEHGAIEGTVIKNGIVGGVEFILLTTVRGLRIHMTLGDDMVFSAVEPQEIGSTILQDNTIWTRYTDSLYLDRHWINEDGYLGCWDDGTIK